MSEGPSAEQDKPAPDSSAVVARPTGWLWAGELAAVAWLAILGLAALVVGGHDAVVGTEINVRLLGSLLFLAGVMLLVGASGLFHRKPVGLSLAMIAALLGLAIGLMLSLTQVVNDKPDGRLTVWAAIGLASAAAAIYVRGLTPPQERAKSIWSRLPVLKSAVSIGLLFSVAQFWYSQIYVATTAPPILTLESRIDKVIVRKHHLVIEGSVAVENTSDTKIQVLASTVNLTGTRYAEGDTVPDSEYARLVRQADQETLASADRHLVEDSGSRNVLHAPLFDDGTFFEAGEKITRPIITWVPRGRYNAMYLDAWINAGRGNALGLDSPEADERRQLPDHKRLTYLTRLPQAGWLRGLTRGDRYLRVEYDSDPLVPPLVAFAPDRKPDPPAGFDERLTRFYGVAEYDSMAVASLP